MELCDNVGERDEKAARIKDGTLQYRISVGRATDVRGVFCIFRVQVCHKIRQEFSNASVRIEFLHEPSPVLYGFVNCRAAEYIHQLARLIHRLPPFILVVEREADSGEHYRDVASLRMHPMIG
jgi:hypothetical protein